MSNESKEEILSAIAESSRTVVELTIEMSRKTEENNKNHEEMKKESDQRFDNMMKEMDKKFEEMNRKFEERDKHHEEMLDKLKADIDKRFDQNDEAHRYLQLAIDTLGILSKENDIDHAEYNQKLNINRIKFSSQ